MKKIFVLLFVFVSCLCFGGNCFVYANATEIEDKYFLIEETNIITSELRSFTPLDYSTNKMMSGRSFSPQVSNETTQEFDRTYDINATLINNNQSLFMYVFFSEELANNLTIKLSDAQDNSLSWFIESQTIIGQIVDSSNSNNVRYGWQLLELPISAGQKVGELSVVTKLSFIYKTDDANNINSYARLTIYQPYVSNLQNTQITFSNKQNFFNFKLNFGTNFDKFCVGDTWEITDWKQLFEYCVIGDIDYLNVDTNLYKFKLEVLDENYDVVSAGFLKEDSPLTINFTKLGTHTFRVTLYNKANEWLWKALDQQTDVREFIAVYISSNLSNLDENSIREMDLNIGSLVLAYNNMQAISSDTEVAEVKIENGKLVVETKKSGKATITLKINAVRANAQEQSYEYHYALSVQRDNTNSILWLILGGIVLLIAGVLVYIIMVKRRLIPGKYPKY